MSEVEPVAGERNSGPVQVPAGNRRADALIACIQRVAVLLDTPASAALLRASLAMGADGYLPWHQLGPALSLLGLEFEEGRGRRLPRQADQYPMIAHTGESEAIVLEARRDDDVLAWHPGGDEPVWTSAAQFSPATGESVRYMSVFGDPAAIREAGQPWHQRARGHWFWSEVRKRRREFWPVILASAVINLLAVALPLFTMNVYDRVIPNRASASLWALAIGVVLAFALEFALRKARTNVLDTIGRDLDLTLAQKIFSRVMATPMAAKAGHTGNLVARVGEYAIVRDFFAATTIVLIVDMAFLVVFVAFIALIAGWLAMVPVVAILAMIALGYYLQRRITDTARDAQADYGLQQTLLMESLAGAETLKSISGEGAMLGRWHRLSQMSARSQLRLRTLNATATGAATTFQQMSTISLIIGGYYLFAAGAITMGAIIAIVMLSSRALAPAGQLAFLLTRWRQVRETLDSIQRLWDSADERRMGGATIAPSIRAGRIRLQNVSLNYPDASVASLDDIDLTIEPGERIAVIGRVAAGKSTLGRLLCGLYEPTEGSVLIDGVDARQYRPQDIRRAFRFVAQDSNLFSGTVKDNLALGLERVDEAAMIAALRKVGADRFLAQDAGGFDRAVGEQGRQLSGGQRSFLVLARAMLRPSRLIYLDEPTGAMDSRTEKMFIEALKQSLDPSQTLVVATHRPGLFDLCERIIVLDGGRIVADGPKREIIAGAGLENRF